jgi:ribosomal-protein-alanine N-acetyltransferase
MSAALALPEKLRLRPMREDDVPQVIQIEEAATAYPWTEVNYHDCLRMGYCAWVFEVGGWIGAYGMMSVEAGESHILNLGVRPDLQGRGLGRRMLEQLLEVARGHGAERMFLEVRPSNPVAIQLYQKAGFTEIGQRKDYYPADDGREDALVLSLWLL